MNKKIWNRFTSFVIPVASLWLLLSTHLSAETEMTLVQQQVWQAEEAFAKSMADRDFAAFSGFVADDAIFMGGRKVNRGKQAILASWKKLFQKAEAPFARKPERVEVLEEGNLALSTGPVWDELGRFQTYTSIWRKNNDGKWRVIFDKGDRYCPKQSEKPN